MYETKRDYYLALLEVNHLLVNFPETLLKVSVQNSLTNELIIAFYKLSIEHLSTDDYVESIKQDLFSVRDAHKAYLQKNFPTVFN